MVGDLQALTISPSCMDFALGLVKVFLLPRPDYVPKVASIQQAQLPFQQVVLQAFSPADAGSDSPSLCAQPSGMDRTSCLCVLVVRAEGLLSPTENVALDSGGYLSGI